MRTDITTQIVRNGWPILGLSAYTTDIEKAVLERTNVALQSYGVALTRMGNFDINLAPEDAEQLKKLAKDTSYSRLAGSFNNYAQGEMALGAGQGMAQGGGAVQGAFLGLGMGMGGQGAQAYPPAAPPQTGFAGGGQGGYVGPPPVAVAAPVRRPPPAATITCVNCGTANPAGAKFCVNCGQPPAPAAHALHAVRHRAPGRCEVLRELRHPDRSRRRGPRPGRRAAARRRSSPGPPPPGDGYPQPEQFQPADPVTSPSPPALSRFRAQMRPPRWGRWTCAALAQLARATAL